MSNILVWANNASTTLASAISNSQTTITVAAGTGVEFPAPAAGQIAIATIEDTAGDIEVVWITGITGDVLTVSRGEEGTTPVAFASGSRIEQRPTAGTMQAFLQKNGGDTMTNTTTLNGVLQLNSSGSIQGGEFTGYHRSGAGVTTGQIYVSSGTPMSGTSVILTAANLTGNLPSGTALCLTNMIVFWAGASNAIPTGWHLCDGTNGTPNLRDQFIVGGGGALPTSGTYSANTSRVYVTQPTVAGSIAAANLPRHTHGSTLYSGNGAISLGPTGQAAGSYYATTGSGAGTAQNWLTDTGTGLLATPTPLSITLADSTGHVHTQSVPYTAVFAIMKL